MRRTVKLGFRSRHGIENRNTVDNRSFMPHGESKPQEEPRFLFDLARSQRTP
jgi:hypothetical protein